MDIIRTSLLSAGQADEIKELLNGCRDSKPINNFRKFKIPRILNYMISFCM